ncbi:nuclear transport factor 2 family protein [Flavobacterium jejuense]|uniref:Nuclear transport factor 2 family protein n=1 Tax=Flavobacterium jejuense TaxID=1544455 RepID=A0ABX0IVC6_9FLAO|nr:nuclear transport factor 2 family protein [Flavobacterium jejuense]NHN25764.1 nuclear transport factor 2 family protein [Flavobacterium jejuense]
MKSFFLSTLFFLISYSLVSQNNMNSNDSIATAYMKAYGDWNFDTMKTFYSEDIHFEDPTAEKAFGQPFLFKGKENVYAFFKGVFKDRFKNNKPPYVNFIIEKKFCANSFVIINSTFECVIPTSWFKKESKETILIAIPFVTILEIENGKIKKHTDYGDYSKYNAQIKAQLGNG